MSTDMASAVFGSEPGDVAAAGTAAAVPPSAFETPPLPPHVIVIFGAAGDLARRKLLPGLMHLEQEGLLPECRIIGTALDELDDEAMCELAYRACDEFGRTEIADDLWEKFRSRLS